MFTIGFALAQVNAALFAHATLAYPTGRVTGRVELWFVRLVYAVALCVPFLTLLFYGGGGLRYIDPGPRSALLLYGSPWLAEHLDKAYVFGGYGALAAAFVVLVVRKLVLATPRMRRILAPLGLAAGIAGLRALTEAFATLASPARPILSGLYWWQVVGQILLPIVLLVGLLRTHLARVHVGDLLLELDHTPPDGIRRRARAAPRAIRVSSCSSGCPSAASTWTRPESRWRFRRPARSGRSRRSPAKASESP